ncbi:hypothetical protein LHP98_15870 [Rhodobacter sp. Har01]|uniref:hypothetical protein n=1 Tax=Rhodobacter sp. Har01 TaxID=2883999 RepID=UPI001D099272|nr:hypothetical protein [Rhodobacter sp. Har01]MCB6179600.1 hypothetical protein [Rhodobacter sp. Har01]
MKLKALSMTLATTALVALTLPSIAQDKSGSNVSAEGTGTPGATASMAMAHELYALGVASGDALTVLTAAKLAAQAEGTPQEPAALDPEGFELVSDAQTTAKPRGRPRKNPALVPSPEEGAPRPAAKTTLLTAAGDEEGATEAPVTAAAMFAKATELAGDDEALKGMIADAEAEGARGRIGGAVTWESKLPRGQIDVWEVPFYGNSYAEVAIIGDGDANLDMVITDENGNVICYDVSPSDQVYCDFVPAWDGYFYITVENAGRVRNSYYLMTN